MKSLILALCLTSLLGIAANAATRPPAAASPAPKASSYDASNRRNPFWPIGWTKPEAANGGSEAAPALSANAFALTSVTTGGGTRFAILNGKVVQQGQHFGLQSGAQIYQMTVEAVRDGEVVLRYSGGEIVVPLRRR